jgi:hypothetical protein
VSITAWEVQQTVIFRLETTQDFHGVHKRSDSIPGTLFPAVAVYQIDETALLLLLVQGNGNVMEMRIHRDQLKALSNIRCLTHKS